MVICAKTLIKGGKFYKKKYNFEDGFDACSFMKVVLVKLGGVIMESFRNTTTVKLITKSDSRNG